MKVCRLSLLIPFVVLFACLTAFLCGCANSNRGFENDPFNLLYLPDSTSISAHSQQKEKKKFSLTSSSLPLLDFSRWFSDRTGRGVVFSSDLDEKTLIFDFKNASEQEIINLVSRRLGCSAVLQGNTYYIGSLAKDDRGFLVSPVKGYDPSSVTPVISQYLSENGKATFLSNGLVFVSDNASALQRISAVIDKISSVQEATWIIQYYILLDKASASVEYGAKTTTSGELSYNLSKGQGLDAGFEDVGQKFQLILNGESSLVKTVASPMFLVTDNTECKWSDVTTVPIPRKTVSNQGTVTTTGVDYKEVGLLLTVKLRESSGGAILTTNIEDSQIVGYTEYYPETRKSSLESRYNIRAGYIYLIGELNRISKTDKITNLLQFGNDREYTKMFIFCRVYKISPVNPLNPQVFDDYKKEIKRFSESPLKRLFGFSGSEETEKPVAEPLLKKSVLSSNSEKTPSNFEVKLNTPVNRVPASFKIFDYRDYLQDSSSYFFGDLLKKVGQGR